MKVLLGVCFTLLLSVCFGQARKSRGVGDFVESVTCHATGMDIALKQKLPLPRNGMWKLEVEGHPDCPGATRQDVGGGYSFTLLYVDSDLCGTEPKSWFTPSWVSFAEVTLLLKDTNDTVIADSISCLYNTRFGTSLLTFKGEIMSETLRYGGTVEEEGADIEAEVDSSESVIMDFFDESGNSLQSRNVKLGDPIVLKIDVSESKYVSRILPETCYFSSSGVPSENPINSQTLTFIRKSCFNDKNSIVRTILPKMDRNKEGTVYEMPFTAFYFTNYSKNLFVHCTLLACVGSQNLCDPQSDCFGTSRRKRREIADMKEEQFVERFGEHDSLGGAKSFMVTKYVVIEDGRRGLIPDGSSDQNLEKLFASGTVCLHPAHFASLLSSLIACIVVLLITVSCMAAKLAKKHQFWGRYEESLRYAMLNNFCPTPAYTASPTTTTTKF